MVLDNFGPLPILWQKVFRSPLKVENSPFHRRAGARKISSGNTSGLCTTSAPTLYIYISCHHPAAAPPPAYHTAAEEMHDVHYIHVYPLAEHIYRAKVHTLGCMYFCLQICTLHKRSSSAAVQSKQSKLNINCALLCRGSLA